MFKIVLYGNIIFDILEQSSFQEYATCWVFLALCHMLYLCICICLCICHHHMIEDITLFSLIHLIWRGPGMIYKAVDVIWICGADGGREGRNQCIALHWMLYWEKEKAPVRLAPDGSDKQIIQFGCDIQFLQILISPPTPTSQQRTNPPHTRTLHLAEGNPPHYAVESRWRDGTYC